MHGRGRKKQLLVRQSARVEDSGVTLLELVIAITVILILMGAAVPVARLNVKRQKEVELRRDLLEMRSAIGRYHTAALKGLFKTEQRTGILYIDSYPKDLDKLVQGEDVNGKKMLFLRRIPVDPLTGTTDWGKRALKDDPDSTSWSEGNVFDVYTKSEGTALDGTKYKDW